MPRSRPIRACVRPIWARRPPEMATAQRPMTAPASLLKVEGLQAWYGESHILHGVGFEVREGEVVTLLGRNGAGKTTTLKSIMGMVPRRGGSVRLAGQE